MRIKITADSTCDLSPALLEKYDITLAHLIVNKNGEEFIDGVTITPADIFAHVAAGGDLCSTAALGVGDYQDLFAKFASDYDAVVHISISSEFSSSYQNAYLAAAEFDNVRVIDSRNLSTGQGLVVLAACEMGESCTDLDKICADLVELTGRVEASFVLDQLKYMVKGGRCSSAAALGANLLNLKPCIEVRDGKMSVVKKYRGNFTKCLTSYVKDRLEGREDLDTKRLFITRTPVSEDSYAAVKEAVANYSNFDEVIESEAGCTVSCHCGPGTLGVLFIRK
jgi:DegV family protein with EDD domain